VILFPTMNTGDVALMNPPKHPRRRVWRRVLAWGAGLILAALMLAFALLERIAHRPSRVRTTIPAAEIEVEDAQLKQLGLALRDASFLKQHPFEPPWTSHSLLIPESWSEPGIKRLLGPRRVRADLLLADLDVLQAVMERGYGGWDSAAARGWNWNRWFADWRGQLAARGTLELSFDDAFTPMDALFAFQRDNHTQVPLSRWWTSDGSQTALLASAPAAPCTEIRAGGKLFPAAPNDAGQHVRAAKIWNSSADGLRNASYISMPKSYGTPQALGCGSSWIALQPIGNRPGKLSSMLGELWSEAISSDRPRVERIGDGVVYARLPTFDAAHYEHVSRDGWAQRQPADRVLIVDLRDNSGGSADYGLDVLKGWIDESRMVQFGSVGSRITSSCLFAPLEWSYTAGAKRAQLLLDRMAQPYPQGCPRTVETTESKWTYLQRRFQPSPGDLRIVALVNSGCGSDCELLTAMLASLPETIVAGSNTYGLCQLIQPGYSVLPHTGLRYRIALGRSDYYGDNRSVDGYGLDVDLVLPDVDRLTRGQMLKLASLVARQ
jgi:hypothetical protein